jgi:cytochrome c553
MRAMTRTLMLLLLFASGVALASETASAVQERLAACSVCHGERGEGKSGNEYFPHLAGKPSGYLLAQLQAFRDGRRLYPQMNWLMRNMGDAWLGRIADYYADLPPRSSAQPVSMAADAAARALALVEQGDPEHGVTACTACHGADLAGLAPGVPALIGLPPDYVIAQLGAWREGTRSAASPDCMAVIARALDSADFRRLGEWLASQGAAQSLPPAPAGSFTLPVACGSLPTDEAQP